MLLKKAWVLPIILWGVMVAPLPAAFAQSTNAAWLTTTNRLNLPHFWSAVEASNGPVTVLAFGDSMADPGRSIQRELFAMLRARFGNAGDSWLAYSFPSGGAKVLDPSIGGPLPPWWSFHAEVPPVGMMEWQQLQVIPINRVGLYWLAGPEGGDFTLSICTNLVNWSQPLLELNGRANAPEWRYTNIVVSRASYRVRVQGISGTNICIAPEFMDTSVAGIHVAYLSRGGINLNRIFSYPTNLLPSLIATLNPQLVISHMKEIGDIGGPTLSNRLYDLEALWQGCVTNGDVAYIGTPYDYRDDAGEYTGPENVLWREAAIRDGRAYLDCMTPCVSYVAMTNAGWLAYPLDVHPNAIANQFLAQTLWPQLGFFALRAPRQITLRAIEEGVICDWSSVTGLNYELQFSSDAAGWNAVTNLPGQGGAMSWTNASPINQGFYRLSLTPQ